MKSLFRKLALSLIGVLVTLCYFHTTTEQVAVATAGKRTGVKSKQPDTKSAAGEQKPKKRPTIEKPVEQSNVVAEIGDYVIIREELKERLINELRPDRFDSSGKVGPVDVNTVLMKMIAEKAMVIEGRKQDYLKDDAWLKRVNKEKLVRLLLQTHLQSKITVTESEIDKKIKTNPKLDRARAKVMLESAKARRLVDEFYKKICEKLHVQKLRHNLPTVVQIHERLLHSSKEPRRRWWITNKQVREELTPEEKNIILATYDNGKVTLEDWFETLNEMSPPSRPRDLNTVDGVARLLDRAMRMPIFVAEARSRGLDKDENFLKEVRKREDRILLSKVSRSVFKDLKKPTKEEIVDYFNRHKEGFKTADTLKIDQIWCQGFKTAQKVKDELNGGRDFESVKQQYSLKKEEKGFNTSAARDGIFFKELWEGEPNQIIGPVKGFYGNGSRGRAEGSVKWRIVKILDKEPGKMREFSNDVERDVKDRMQREQREAIMDKYRKELLRKFSYKIYSERTRNIDPFDIP